MWVFSLIRFAPRPSLAALAPFLVWLGTYAAFQGQGTTTVLGQPVSGLGLASAAAIVAHVARVTLFWSPARQGRLEFRLGVFFRLAFLAGAGATLFLLDAARLQMGFTVLLMFSALLQLSVLRFYPEDLHRLPSIWAGRHPLAARAMEIVVLSLVLRAATSQALIYWGSEQAWVLFATLGSIAMAYLTNWVIMLMILASDTEET